MTKKNTQQIAGGIAIGLAIAAVAGYYYGSKSRKEKGEKTEKEQTKK